MKAATIIALVLIGMSALAITGKEQQAIENISFNPGEFYGLIINNNSNVILKQGEKNSVRIEGEKSSTRKVKTDIQNGALVINGGNDQVNIYITVKDISLIELNGAGKVFGMGTINSDILLLKVNGSGSMKIDVQSLKVAMIVKGEGKLFVSGSTGECFIKEYGRGKIYANGLHAYTYMEEHTSSSIPTENSAVKI